MITVLMGAPGAGKTTWLEENKLPTDYVASTEAIRVNRHIDRGAYMTHMRINAIHAAEAGQDIIIDGTHTIYQHRLVWLHLAKRLDVPCRLIMFDTPLAYCIQAQYKRKHPAPISIVKEHHARMSIAKRVVKHEGWDEIVVVERVLA